MNLEDYKVNKDNLPSKFDRWLYIKQKGILGIALRGIKNKFQEKFFFKKISTYKTVLDTLYYCFDWDGTSKAPYLANGIPEWGNELLFLYSLRNRKKELFLDIGCHTGYFSCLFNGYFHKIIGFEPSEKCFESLQFLKNKIKNFSCYNCFMSNVNKTVISNQYENGWAFVSNENNMEETKKQWTAETDNLNFYKKKLEIKNIDNFISENNNSLEVSAIKIDVDGFDLEVLKGGLKTIKKYRPSIYFENNGKNSIMENELLNICKELKYKVFTLICNLKKPYNVALKEITKDDRDYYYTNFVLIPEDFLDTNLKEQEIKGNILTGINKKKLKNLFNYPL